MVKVEQTLCCPDLLRLPELPVEAVLADVHHVSLHVLLVHRPQVLHDLLTHSGLARGGAPGHPDQEGSSSPHFLWHLELSPLCLLDLDLGAGAGLPLHQSLLSCSLSLAGVTGALSQTWS